MVDMILLFPFGQSSELPSDNGFHLVHPHKPLACCPLDRVYNHHERAARVVNSRVPVVSRSPLIVVLAGTVFGDRRYTRGIGAIRPVVAETLRLDCRLFGGRDEAEPSGRSVDESPMQFRVNGAFEPAHGLRYNPAKLLLDPYARAIDGDRAWS
jgi:hypothetical protein